jgi:hypothetical protein
MRKERNAAQFPEVTEETHKILNQDKRSPTRVMNPNLHCTKQQY